MRVDLALARNACFESRDARGTRHRDSVEAALGARFYCERKVFIQVVLGRQSKMASEIAR